MAHFAQLDENNVVLRTLRVDNAVVNDLPFPESEPLGVAFLQGLYGPDTIWKQTSYNDSFRVFYAGPGDTYNAEHDAFVPIQPYPSWTWDWNTLQWNPPVPCPGPWPEYSWDEATQTWNLLPPV